MALTTPTGPSNGPSLVLSELKRFSTNTNAIIARNALALAPATLGHPYPVYHMNAAAVAAGKGFGSPEFFGYRYIVDDGGELSTADVRVDANGAATRMLRRGYGEFPKAFTHGLDQIAKLPAVAAGSYEIRILHCSEVFLVAIWLKGAAGHADIIYPLPPVPDGVHAERAYSVDEYVGLVWALIQKRIARPANPIR